MMAATATTTATATRRTKKTVPFTTYHPPLGP